MSDDETFRDFVTRQWEPLSRTAYLLTRDRALAEDLVQSALEKTHRHWRRVDAPEVYTRRVMINTAISWRRRRRWTEVPLLPTDEGGQSDPYGQADNRQVLLRALRSLPPRTQAILVLRYFEDRSEAEIAQVLGCSAGSVKSQASRGIARLRELLRQEGAGNTSTSLLGGLA
ncbi:SigE family RNA polymerase sigma factor [Phytohabitans houttuyneae]|uniref:DNA-directed RNA polymerase sigma-70 factor n=1 Tax=Phytohabitans houttuyneae TaxID=1076126 RepID=A0A6V8KCE3_9ACTN|nr:SigE family RNA polymerase sigma factor [Phytohabitans houttuyneae]GFJ82912.1 DNA-directed RNA polymerase sigma-70 factor [Phytohabitans houttuyneae]